jgi:hypothetical protein
MKQLRLLIAAMASAAVLGGAGTATANAAAPDAAGTAQANAAVLGGTGTAPSNAAAPDAAGTAQANAAVPDAAGTAPTNATAATYWYRGSSITSIPGALVPFPAQPGHDYVSYGTPGNCCGTIPTFSTTYSGGILTSRFTNCDASRVAWCHISHESHLGPGAYAWRNGQALFLNAYQRLSSSATTAGAGFLCYAAVNDQGQHAYACAQTWGGWAQAGVVNCPHESWGNFGGNTYGLFTRVDGFRQGQVASFGWQNFKIQVTAANLANAVHKCYPNLPVDPNQWRVSWIDRGWEAGGLPRAGHPEDGTSSHTVIEDVRQETVYSAPASVLGSGDTLQPGQAIWSPSGAYQATMQPDGNFVVWGGGPVWSSGTYGRNGAYLAMQLDGNLVIRHGAAPIWQLGSVCGYSAGSFLALQDDGSLVLRNADASSRWVSKYGCGIEAPHVLWAGQVLQPNQAIWSPSGAYHAIMQPDGNFVVYGRGGPAWSSGTYGATGSYIAMQHDGNLVIRHGAAPIWQTGSACGYSAGSYLAMQEDGNLVLRNANGTSRWSSRFGCG